MTSALRWHAKKAARHAFAWTAWASGRASFAPSTGRAAGVRVLTYHAFGDAYRDPFCVSAKTFDAQMAYLAKRNSAISLDEFQSFLAGRMPLREDSVLVTIDDGLSSVHSIALPILRHYAIPAVAFVTTSLLRGRARRDGAAGDPTYMDWDEIGQLVAGGLSIGSHAHTHRSLGRMSVAEARDEAERSFSALTQELGGPPVAFAYPFGTRADYSPAAAKALADAGYRLAFTSQHGPVVPGLDPMMLPRIKVESGEGIGTYRLLVHGGLDGWRLIDGALWWLQASGR